MALDGKRNNIFVHPSKRNKQIRAPRYKKERQRQLIQHSATINSSPTLFAHVTIDCVLYVAARLGMAINKRDLFVLNLFVYFHSKYKNKAAGKRYPEDFVFILQGYQRLVRGIRSKQQRNLSEQIRGQRIKEGQNKLDTLDNIEPFIISFGLWVKLG